MTTPLVLAVLLAALPAAPPSTVKVTDVSSAGNTQTVFVGLLRAVQVDANLAGVLTDLLTHELAGQNGFEVLSVRDLEAIATKNALNEAVGCIEQRCQVDLARRVEARLLVGGSLARIEDLYLVTLELTDMQSSKVVRRVKAQVQGTDKDLVKLVEEAAPKLLSGRGAVHGEMPETPQAPGATRAAAPAPAAAARLEKKVAAAPTQKIDEKTITKEINAEVTRRRTQVKHTCKKLEELKAQIREALK